MTTVTSSGTLAPGVAAQIAPAMPDAKLVIICVNGVNPMVAKFGVLPTSNTDGIPLDGASVSGSQGGSLVLAVKDEKNLTPPDYRPPPDAIYAVSALGTTFSVVQVDGADKIAPWVVRHGYA
jgi:hypothetical protein